MIIRSLLFCLGLATGGLLIIALYLLIGTSPTPQSAAAVKAPPAPTMIVVAARDIPAGTLISLRDLKFAPSLPGQITAADFVRDVGGTPIDQRNDDHRVFGQIGGAVTRTRFNEGEPILRGMIVKPGDAGFLAAVLRPQMRAVTMSINVVTGAAGLVMPGDHVDIILTQIFRGQVDPGHASAAGTIASGLRVIAVDQRLQADEDLKKDGQVAKTVTVEVTALQAEQINLAAKMGDLALSIRGVQSDVGPAANTATIASRIPPPIWAKDVSPELNGAFSPRGTARRRSSGRSDGSSGKPQLSVYRGDKVESIALP